MKQAIISFFSVKYNLSVLIVKHKQIDFACQTSTFVSNIDFSVRNAIGQMNSAD